MLPRQDARGINASETGHPRPGKVYLPGPDHLSGESSGVVLNVRMARRRDFHRDGVINIAVIRGIRDRSVTGLKYPLLPVTGAISGYPQSNGRRGPRLKELRWCPENPNAACCSLRESRACSDRQIIGGVASDVACERDG